MELNFEKWHGCRNDFIVLTLPDLDSDLLLGSLRRQSTKLCDRHSGIGADGILVLWTKKIGEKPHSLSIINSDGSLAHNCGNGLRCAMGSILKATHASPLVRKAPGHGSNLPGSDDGDVTELTVEGLNVTLRIIGKSNAYPFIAVDMPTPHLNQDLDWWDTGKCELDKVMEQARVRMELKKLTWETGACEIGNRHLIVLTDLASRDLLLQVGPALQKSPLWDGINVHICRSKQISDKDQARAGQEVGGKLSSIFDVWVWERGAGETAACGSGAVAIGAHVLSSGLEDRDQWIGIDMPGGRLYVKQGEADAPAILAGPTEFIFEGKLNL